MAWHLWITLESGRRFYDTRNSCHWFAEVGKSLDDIWTIDHRTICTDRTRRKQVVTEGDPPAVNRETLVESTLALTFVDLRFSRLHDLSFWPHQHRVIEANGTAKQTLSRFRKPVSIANYAHHFSTRGTPTKNTNPSLTVTSGKDIRIPDPASLTRRSSHNSSITL